MTLFFLGVDTGATKGHALIADEHGKAIGFGQGGPGNWETVGWEGAHATLQAITIEATMPESIHSIAPLSLMRRLQVPPVVGGVPLAMEQVGLHIDLIRPDLLATAGQLMRCS